MRLTSSSNAGASTFNIRNFLCCALSLWLILCGASHNVAVARVIVVVQDLDDVSLSGRVTDQNGAVVVGAQVTATLSTPPLTRTVTTDNAGRFRLVELPPGTYTVRASSAGFAVEERTGLSTLAGQNVQLDFVLRPAGVTAEQSVVSDAGISLIDPTRTVVGGTITREEVERLPLSTRAPLDFIFTLPGVTEEPLSTRDVAEDRDSRGRASIERAGTTPEEAGTFALSGGAAYSNNITIDGLDNNDDRAARERFQPSIEAVAEVQVITNQFSAEYGRASGGRINLRTRGGTNELHGRFFDFFKDESLNANSFNNRRRNLKRLPMQEHNPGFTLGGPVVIPRAKFSPFSYDGRDKTFFFVAYEYDTVLDSTLIDALVPVRQNALFPLPAPTILEGRRTEPSATAPNAPADLAPFVERVSTPLRNHIFTARLDHKFTELHNGAFVFQFGRLRNLRQFGGGLRLAETLQGRTRDTDALAYTDNLVFSPTLVNQLRVQISRLRPSLQSQSGGVDGSPVALISINDPLDSDDVADRSGTLVAGSSNSGATDRRETRFQLQDSLTVVRGAHTLKFGGDFQRIRSTFIDLSDITGTYSFTSAGDFLANMPSRFRQRFNTESSQKNIYTGFFAQDEWRARPNLTLSFGLRYDNETILHDRNNFAPRIAAAFDPFGTGKTVLRFGAGIFYNRALLRTVDDFTLGKQLLEFDTDNLPVAARRSFIAANLRFPNALDVGSPLVKQYGAQLTDFSRRLDPAIRIPESYQTNVGIERGLGGKFVVETNYTFNRGIHLWREFNANAPRLPAGFKDFSAYLLSRDFSNFRSASGARPIYNTTTAGELVRFTNAPVVAGNSEAIGRIIEFGVPVSVFNLNSINSTTALEVALAALQNLRPDPTRTQVEQLISAGNSFYHGLTLELRRGFTHNESGAGFSFRAAYTLSRLIDDGIVNTSSALRVGDFRGERSRSLLDRRHRFVFSGTLDAPHRLGGLRFATILRLASGAPFNLSAGGVDRNLDDVSNDRPNFNGDPRIIRYRQPDETLDARLLNAFTLPTIGQTGNLPRNAGIGPGYFTFDLNITREFRIGEHARVRPVAEFDNVLNKNVFTYGAEFINFDALNSSATSAQQQAFRDSFLVPTHTLRARTVRLGLRFDF